LFCIEAAKLKSLPLWEDFCLIYWDQFSRMMND
jgi:hypothetical protein